MSNLRVLIGRFEIPGSTYDIARLVTRIPRMRLELIIENLGFLWSGTEIMGEIVCAQPRRR